MNGILMFIFFVRWGDPEVIYGNETLAPSVPRCLGRPALLRIRNLDGPADYTRRIAYADGLVIRFATQEVGGSIPGGFPPTPIPDVFGSKESSTRVTPEIFFFLLTHPTPYPYYLGQKNPSHSLRSKIFNLGMPNTLY